jgi:hypothetical protein
MASEFIGRLRVKKSEAFRALSRLIACCGVVGLGQAESTPPIIEQAQEDLAFAQGVEAHYRRLEPSGGGYAVA